MFDNDYLYDIPVRDDVWGFLFFGLVMAVLVVLAVREKP
jgi:hypothetical protein